MSLLKLFASVFKRIFTAITSPFRMLLIQAQRLFNVQIITAKLIQPLTKNVRKLLRLKPTEKSDYISVGRFLIFKQLLALLILAACAGVFIYFNIYAAKVAAPPVTLQMVKTDVSYRYDDINVKSFSGTANILSFDNKIIYTGEIENGVCQGQGMLFNRDGQLIYEGGFQNNRYQGYGVKYNPEGTTEYEGEFQENLYNGAGKLFNARGTLIYDGSFKKGDYDGDGKLYSDRGHLLYEGQFAANQRHGTGIEYYDDGTTHYKGEFFQDVFQGRGELFGTSGKLLYTGAMYSGKINYRSLVGATLEDVENSFADTPLIYYEEDGSVCFFYEKTGVIISTDCRIKVYETEREKDDPAEGLYYLPDEEGYYLPPSSNNDGEAESQDNDTNLSPSSQPESSESQPPSADQADPSSQNEPDLPEDFTLLRASRQSLRQLDKPAALPEIKPMAWVIIDPYSSSSSSGSDSSSSSSSSQSESSVSQSQSSESSSSSSSSSASSSSASQSDLDQLPDFVEKTKTLYFEVDTDVWQAEGDLDKTKVFIRRVTVVGQEPSATGDVTEIEDNSAPSVEDCVAIETLRRKSPTAFPDVSFQLDGQNKLFHRVWNINHTNRIARKTYLSGDLTVRYCYEPDNGSVPAYYSIES